MTEPNTTPSGEGDGGGTIKFEPETPPPGSPAATTVREEQIDQPTATLRVFGIVAELVIYALVIYLVLLLFSNSTAADRFATVVAGPLITILAGAAGYYFGRRDESK